jgi:DNA-binding SARP family transcriptional activator
VLFHVLGPLEVHGPAGHRLGAGKPAVVLATLLLEPNAWVPVDRLVEAVWPEPDVPASAAANLKTYVWRLRRLLPDGATRIERRADAYRIRVAPGELDADRAARALDGGSLPLVEDALALWRGRPYSGVSTPAADAAAVRLDDLRLDLQEKLARLHLDAGRDAAAIAALRLVTAEAPLREGAWALLVRTLHAAGRRSEALAAYRRAAGVLGAELGVRPGPALAAAYRPVAGPRELPPGPGLVGRAAERAALGRAVPVTVVTGMPGAGKTALAVHVAHRLAGDFPDGQFFVDLHGGDHRPADVLARLLRGVGVPTAALPDDLGERAARWRSETAGRRLLLVLDDAADAGQVAPLLPATPTARTLITTRNRGWHPAGAARIEVEPLGDAAAATLLGAPGGADVLRHCGGLPAALVEAAARLRTRPGWTVRDLAGEVGADPCRVLRDACRRLSGAPRWLGALPARFDAAAAAGLLGVPERDARADLETLVDRGLLDTTGPGVYRSHPLVRHVAACGAATVHPLPDRPRAA